MKTTVGHDEFMREQLADTEFAAGYLQAALDDGDRGVLLLALRRVAEARGGIAQLAQTTGLTREALYRTLSASGNPRLTSLWAILDATGFRLTITPAERPRKRGKSATTGKRPRIAAIG
jgi:probable addiction module antidote protein